MKYLILLSGKINSGKNQFATFLEEEFTKKGLKVKQDLYAADLKNYSYEDFKVLGEVLKNKVEAIKATIGVYFSSKYGLPLEIQSAVENMLNEFTYTKDNFYENKTDITRVLLQTYGTDIARKRFDDHFWIKKMAERVNGDRNTDVIIVTDVRFPNELEDIHDYVKGWRIIPIRIERDIPRQEIMNEHISETALDDYNFWEYIVDNNGTLEEFKESSIALINNMLISD
jgi:hypothetical protein